MSYNVMNHKKRNLAGAVDGSAVTGLVTRMKQGKASGTVKHGLGPLMKQSKMAGAGGAPVNLAKRMKQPSLKGPK